MAYHTEVSVLPTALPSMIASMHFNKINFQLYVKYVYTSIINSLNIY